MNLLKIAKFMFCSIFLQICPSSTQSTSQRTWRPSGIYGRDNCICFPKDQSLIPDQINLQDDLERLVVYLYKDRFTNRIKVYVPSREKQALIPNMPFTAGDKLKTITTETVASLMPSKNYFLTRKINQPSSYIKRPNDGSTIMKTRQKPGSTDWVDNHKLHCTSGNCYQQDDTNPTNMNIPNDQDKNFLIKNSMKPRNPSNTDTSNNIIPNRQNNNVIIIENDDVNPDDISDTDDSDNSDDSDDSDDSDVTDVNGDTVHHPYHRHNRPNMRPIEDISNNPAFFNLPKQRYPPNHMNVIPLHYCQDGNCNSNPSNTMPNNQDEGFINKDEDTNPYEPSNIWYNQHPSRPVRPSFPKEATSQNPASIYNLPEHQHPHFLDKVPSKFSENSNPTNISPNDVDDDSDIIQNDVPRVPVNPYQENQYLNPNNGEDTIVRPNNPYNVILEDDAIPLDKDVTPKKKYETFDQWFNRQIQIFHDANAPQAIKAIRSNALRPLVQNTLLENKILIDEVTGHTTNPNGVPIDLNKLELRPILIGNPVAYQPALQGPESLRLPKRLPYLEAIVITLRNPTRILGVIPLGKTFISQRSPVNGGRPGTDTENKEQELYPNWKFSSYVPNPWSGIIQPYKKSRPNVLNNGIVTAPGPVKTNLEWNFDSAKPNNQFKYKRIEGPRHSWNLNPNVLPGGNLDLSNPSDQLKYSTVINPQYPFAKRRPNSLHNGIISTPLKNNLNVDWNLDSINPNDRFRYTTSTHQQYPRWKLKPNLLQSGISISPLKGQANVDLDSVSPQYYANLRPSSIQGGLSFKPFKSNLDMGLDFDLGRYPNLRPSTMKYYPDIISPDSAASNNKDALLTIFKHRPTIKSPESLEVASDLYSHSKYRPYLGPVLSPISLPSSPLTLQLPERIKSRPAYIISDAGYTPRDQMQNILTIPRISEHGKNTKTSIQDIITKINDNKDKKNTSNQEKAFQLQDFVKSVAKILPFRRSGGEDNLNFKINGGSTATASGAPLSNKGRSGLSDGDGNIKPSEQDSDEIQGKPYIVKLVDSSSETPKNAKAGDGVGVRITGGSAATASGSPLSNKGRSGLGGEESDTDSSDQKSEDHQNITHIVQSIVNSSSEKPKDVDDGLGIRITGGSAATASGSPLNNKGRSGLNID